MMLALLLPVALQAILLLVPHTPIAQHATLAMSAAFAASVVLFTRLLQALLATGQRLP